MVARVGICIKSSRNTICKPWYGRKQDFPSQRSGLDLNICAAVAHEVGIGSNFLVALLSVIDVSSAILPVRFFQFSTQLLCPYFTMEIDNNEGVED